ncbi:hypothetical protein J7M28_09970, partial [bacterium]|nr:hypothetical protein [bacterium]
SAKGKKVIYSSGVKPPPMKAAPGRRTPRGQPNLRQTDYSGGVWANLKRLPHSGSSSGGKALSYLLALAGIDVSSHSLRLVGTMYLITPLLVPV